MSGGVDSSLTAALLLERGFDVISLTMQLTDEQTSSALRFLTVIAYCRVVGCDLVEPAPNYDPSGVSTLTAVKLMREMLLTWATE